jgi:hypothetical protein
MEEHTGWDVPPGGDFVWMFLFVNPYSEVNVNKIAEDENLVTTA